VISALVLDVFSDGDLTFPLCTESGLEEAGMSWQANQGMVWVNVVNPTLAEMYAVANAFNLHHLAVEDAIYPRPRPELDDYGDFMTLFLYVPRITDPEVEPRDPAAEAVPPFGLEIGRGGLAPMDHVYLIFGHRLLVTVARQPIAILNQVAIRCHNDASVLTRGMGGLVHYVVDQMVDAYFQVLDLLSERVEAVQEFAFLGPGKVNAPQEMRALYNIKRDLMALRRVMVPQTDAIRLIAREGIAFYKEPEDVYFQDIFDHAIKVQQTIQVYLDLLTSARESYLTRVSNELATAARALLIVVMFISVPTIVVTAYGMNHEHIPELRWPFGHLWAIFLVAAADLALLAFVRRKGVV
jgi:magnesium transporter